MIGNNLDSLKNTQDAMFNVVEHPVTSLIKDDMSAPLYIAAPNKKMLVKEVSNTWPTKYEYLSVVNNTYNVIQNWDVISTINEQLVEAFGFSMFDGTEDSCQTRVGVSGKGVQTYVYYDFPKIKTDIVTTNGHKTKLGFRVIFKNSFDGSSKVVLYLGHIDFFCQNGMVTGEYSVVSQSHRSALKVKDFTHKFTEALENYEDSTRKYREMAQTKTNSQKTMDLFYKLVHGKQVAFEDIQEDRNSKRPSLASKLFDRWVTVDSIERGQNVYSVMSTLTNFSSHNSNTFPLRRGNEDSVVSRMHRREEKVTRWLNSDAWNSFAIAA